MSPLALKVTSLLASLLIRLLGATWRTATEGPDPLGPPYEESDAPRLAALYHDNILIAAWYFRDRGFSTAVSRSRDGDLIAALLDSLGYRAPARGSSSRGGAAALHRLLHMLKSGITLSLQTDGPRGPAHISKPGIVTLARLSGVAITPVAFSARPCVRFKSWDQTLLPLPFARVVCRYGTPIEVPVGADEGKEEALCRLLDEKLEAMEEGSP